MDDYWELLPRYQGVEVDDLKFLRILYGILNLYNLFFWSVWHSIRVFVV